MTSEASAAATARVEQKYLPPAGRSGLGLCLSGGGYRAALFHLGAARRLHELGVLRKVAEFSSVSGGSIFAAFLATKWSAFDDGGSFETQVAAPFRAFVKNNIRNAPVLSALSLHGLLDTSAAAESLQGEYERLLFRQLTLKDLPENPKFHICATDLAFGVNWEFTRDRVGDYQAGYMNAERSGAIPLAKAVAASSCFPPVFLPMALGLSVADLPELGAIQDPDVRRQYIPHISLSDGGVYDNLGLEPLWKRCRTLLVSDGGKPLGFSDLAGRVSDVMRIIDVANEQGENLRKRWLIASYIKQVFEGAYFGIRTAVSDYGVGGPGYSDAFVKKYIVNIRTDLNRFSDAEISVLENHGYLLVDAAVRKHTPNLAQPDVPLVAPPNAGFWPVGNLDEIETAAGAQLADSGRRSLIS